MCQPCAPAVGPAFEIEILGASHMSFLDNPNCGLPCSFCTTGSDEPDMTRMLTRRYLTAFFNLYLNETDGYLDYLSGAAMDADVEAGLVIAVSK